MRDTLRLLLFCSFCWIASAQSERDFSGRWYFKPEKSELQTLPEQPEAVMQIDQRSGVIHEARVTGADGKAEEIRSYSVDGHTTRRTVGEITMNCQTKWEGAALLTSTIVSSPNSSYTIADRWRLSRDGSRLTIVRHIIRSQGETESMLIYERTAKPLAAPTMVTTARTPRTDSEEPVAPRPAEEVAPATLASAATAPAALPMAAPAAPVADFVVAQGTKLPLRLINSVDTKHSSPGDRVYLETVYPVLSHGHVIIPPGSYVMGSLTEVQQAGRIKGKSSFFLRFDSLTLPNGTTRDFRSRMSGMDGDGKGSLDRKEGSVVGESGKGSDARTIGTTTAIGTGVGAAIGSAAGHLGMGAGIGAAAGALGGLASVLATRGPDAVLQRGTTVEMVLDRDLTFTRAEVNSR